MSNLNEQQFAKYTQVEDTSIPDWDVLNPNRYIQRPAHLERHAPGEYQPTLPGMERMLPGERTHTSVFFKHPNAAKGEWGDIAGSDWYNKTATFLPDHPTVGAHTLHPTQDWMDENHLHEPIHPNTLRNQGSTPKVEKIGRKNVVQDGHHRAVRAILEGQKRIQVERY